jgi:uncharacterized protein DUF3987/DNA primase RepB-like protein
MHEYFFLLPEELNVMLAKIEELTETEVDLYFCPQLFDSPSRRKDNVRLCPSAWADLDGCRPDETMLSPSLITETSPGRFQGLWVAEVPLTPKEGEELSKRIAYLHADKGCDRSGWDLTQLLRVPETYNYKYLHLETGPVVVRVVGAGRPPVYRHTEFSTLPEVTLSDYEKIPMPSELPAESAKQIMEMFRFKLPDRVWYLFEDAPQDKEGRSVWSESLFALEMNLFEAGMTREQVFKVCESAACNKFARDGRSIDFLWQDVCRAWGRHNDNLHKLNVIDPSPMELLTSTEYALVKDHRTFIEEYTDWASSLGDAAVQYHQASAFMILSGLLSGCVCLPTSFGRIFPNLWFMILADTTLTRKSTAMDLATDMLVEVNSDAILATDGSIEGLLTGLASRPGRPSMFLRDEFSGLLEQMSKKDYYSGMAETLTKLYDGKIQKRMLKREVVEVRDPRLVIFAAGIKKRTQQLLTFNDVSSGFIPRFLFVTAESDMDRLKPLGPPTDVDLTERYRLLEKMTEIHNFYGREELFELPNGVKIPKPKVSEAQLTSEAWVRYNQFESDMLRAGLASEMPDLMTPLYDRLAKSTLKAILLLTAARQIREDITITLEDVLLGIKYASGWRSYAIEVINGIGKGMMENQLDSVMSNIRRNPGVSRGQLMRNHHLTAREADAIFSTLEQRGLIAVSKVGKGWTYNAA